jgi:hypothetical protein
MEKERGWRQEDGDVPTAGGGGREDKRERSGCEVRLKCIGTKFWVRDINHCQLVTPPAILSRPDVSKIR